MGIILGLIGAGGSILTIPILKYFLNIPIIQTTSYSLIIVGTTALMGVVRHRRSINFKKSIVFAIPSVLGVVSTRHYIVPNLPQTLGPITIEKALVILLICFMFLAGFFMINSKTSPSSTNLDIPTTNHSFTTYIMVSCLAFGLGFVMGLLGAGGGFLIIPTLIIFLKYKMQDATRTSLFIVMINSFIGFSADKQPLSQEHWINIFTYISFSLTGMLIGAYLEKFIQSNNLKKIFGYFLLSLASTILIREFITLS